MQKNVKSFDGFQQYIHVNFSFILVWTTSFGPTDTIIRIPGITPLLPEMHESSVSHGREGTGAPERMAALTESKR